MFNVCGGPEQNESHLLLIQARTVSTQKAWLVFCRCLEGSFLVYIPRVRLPSENSRVIIPASGVPEHEGSWREYGEFHLVSRSAALGPPLADGLG